MEQQDAFETMMRDNGPKIYTLAVRLTGNVTDGHDLAQEAFIKAWQHWDQFRGDAQMSTWLYRICVNTWKNRVRYEKRRAFWRHFSLDDRGADDDKPVREIPSAEPALDRPMEKSQEVEALHRALRRMKDQDRAILVLFEMEDRSYEEIAEFLEISIGTVRSRLSRSRDKLKELLENEMKSTI